MLGMVNQSEAEKADQDALDNLRYQAIDQNLGQQQSVDVLQQGAIAAEAKICRTLSRGS